MQWSYITFPLCASPFFALQNYITSRVIHKRRSHFIPGFLTPTSPPVFESQTWYRLKYFSPNQYEMQVTVPTTTYSDLPNNCAANLIIFWEKTHLHNLIRTYTFINFWDFSFKPWFSPIKMRKSSSYMALLRPTRLLISEKSATYTIKWSYTIIWQVRVALLQIFFNRL